MKCQEVALLLDDADVLHLPARVERAVAIHLRACPDCARDWQLHQALVRKALPAVPAALAPACRALVCAVPSRRSHRATRVLVVGAIALAAAAAIWIASRKPQQPDLVLQPAASDASPVVAPPVEEAAPAASGSPAEAEAPKAPATGMAAPAFSIWLLPPDTGSDDAAIRSVARELHERVLDQLRAVPGASVSEGDLASGRRPDYILQIINDTLNVGDQSGLWRFKIEVQVLRSTRTEEQLAAYDKAQATRSSPGSTVDGYVRSFGYSTLVSLEVPCKMGMCAARQAADAVDTLRLNVFSQDEAKLRDILSRFTAAGTDFATRQKLLGDFNSLSAAGRPTPVDAQFIQVILEMHADAPDQVRRMALWNTLSKIADPRMVEPIVVLLDRERDVQMRAMLASRLVTDFSEDAGARAALEKLAIADSSELVRQVAQRAAAGQEGWHQYVNATLTDRSLPPQQRWEPVEFLIAQATLTSQGPDQLDQSLGKLEADARAALVELLPRLWADLKPENIGRTTRLMNLFNSVKDPAFATLLLKGLDGGSPFSRTTLVNMLGGYADDASVAPTLERLRDTDADAKVREAAARALARRQVAGDTAGGAEPNP